MKKYLLLLAVCAATIAVCAVMTMNVKPTNAQGGGVAAPAPIPQLNYRLDPTFFKYPPQSVIGRTTGMAINPKNGNIMTLNRGYRPMMEFKSDGTFIRYAGEGSGMFLGAHVVRYDAQGDLWYVAAADNWVVHFDAEGRTAGTLGSNPEPWVWLTHGIERSVPSEDSFYQPTDIGWSKDGTNFIADGYGNSRVVKYSKDGLFIKAWGKRGNQPGNFNTPHSLVIDNNDLIYVADRANDRVQVFDTDGNLKSVFRLPGPPWALCLTNGPNQSLFVGSIGRVFKLDLSGKILGSFGRPGRMPGTIDSVHQMACPDEKVILMAHTFAARFDKWVLQ